MYNPTKFKTCLLLGTLGLAIFTVSNAQAYCSLSDYACIDAEVRAEEYRANVEEDMYEMQRAIEELQEAQDRYEPEEYEGYNYSHDYDAEYDYDPN